MRRSFEYKDLWKYTILKNTAVRRSFEKQVSKIVHSLRNGSAALFWVNIFRKGNAALFWVKKLWIYE